MTKPDELWGDQHLREWRAGRKISTSDAAHYLGISTKTLWSWENGAYPRDLRERMIAAEARRTGQSAEAKPTAQRYAGRPKSPERVFWDYYDQMIDWLNGLAEAHRSIVRAQEFTWYESERQRGLALEAAKKTYRAGVAAYYKEHPLVDLPPVPRALYYSIKGLPVPPDLPPEPEEPHGLGREPNDDDFPFIPFVAPKPDLAAIRAEALERFGVYLLLDEGLEPGQPVIRETHFSAGRHKGKKLLIFRSAIDWSRSTKTNPFEAT